MLIELNLRNLNKGLTNKRGFLSCDIFDAGVRYIESTSFGSYSKNVLYTFIFACKRNVSNEKQKQHHKKGT